MKKNFNYLIIIFVIITMSLLAACSNEVTNDDNNLSTQLTVEPQESNPVVNNDTITEYDSAIINNNDNHLENGYFDEDKSISLDSILDFITFESQKFNEKWEELCSETFTIKYDSNGGNDVLDLIIDKELIIAFPDDPVKDGYIFAGWFIIDDQYSLIYNLEKVWNDLNNKCLTFYARWTESEEYIDIGTEGLAYTLINNNTEYSVNYGSATSTTIRIPKLYNNLPVTTIENMAFYYCMDITSISIGSNVKIIGDYAFNGCYSLLKITLSSNVESIGEYVFNCCTSLENIIVADNNNKFSSLNGVLYNKNRTTLLCCPSKKSGKFIIPSSVINIGDGAFYFCKDITEFVIPSNVKNIGCSSFALCLGITDINIPDSVTSIEYAAFVSCENLVSVKLSNNITFISDYLFDNCYSLKNIVLPNKVTHIGFWGFAFCYSLESITLNNVISIDNQAFIECYGLKNITIPNCVTTIGSDVFYKCNELSIYCQASSKPVEWDINWNSSSCPVYWNQ